MTDLLKRTLTGVVFVLVLIVGTIFNPYAFGAVFAILLALSLNEFYNLVKSEIYTPQKVSGMIIGTLVFALFFLHSIGIIRGHTVFFSFPLIASIFIVELYRKKENPFINISITILGIIYIAIPFSLLNFIVFPGMPVDNLFYPWILLGIFLIIWAYDSFAYLFGCWLGKHRLFESISPKKSWEGVTGGGVFAVVMGILNSVFFQSLEMVSWMVISLIVIVAGTFGDLAESLLKRSLDIKDSGNILPGHGGFIDRFDSLLLAIPFIFAWLKIFNH